MFLKKYAKRIKAKSESHKKGLLKLYKNQLKTEKESKFMTMVLKSAINKLKNSTISSKKIENWVINLEKLWRKIKF